MDSVSLLREAIRTTPIPGAPPSVSREAASVGLAFLDIALRQNHLRRLTERVSVIEHGAASRRTEVDINLSLLDEGQRDALRLYNRIRTRAKDPDGSPGAVQQNSTLWVPIARISSRSVAPIDVFDATNNRLNRLTQYDTTNLLAAGLYQLLKGILVSKPDAGHSTSEIGQMLFSLDQSRWLLQSALLTLLLDHSKPTHETAVGGGRPDADGWGASVRDFTIKILDDCEEDLLQYQELLDIALNDYLVVVALDGDRTEHVLAYDSPLHGGATRRLRWEPLRWVRGQAATYALTYHSSFSSTLPSYHLVVETETGVQIDSMTLTTNRDERLATRCSADLITLASRLPVTTTGGLTAPQKITDLEIQSSLKQLSELLRRRRWEADQANLVLDPNRMTAVTELSQLMTARETSVQQISEPGPGGPEPKAEPFIQNALVTPTRLVEASKEIGQLELGSDLTVENDPASGRAHVYWRKRRGSAADAGRIELRASVTLSDATQTRPYSIVSYALALAGIVYLVGLFLSNWLWPFYRDIPLDAHSNQDAVVAVLLLVPGFLYTRLDLPQRNSVAAMVHVVPRVVAHGCVGALAGLAAAVAGGVEGMELHWLFFAVIVGLLASVGLLVYQRKPLPFEQRILIGTPAWVGPRGAARGSVNPDAEYFTSYESVNERASR